MASTATGTKSFDIRPAHYILMVVVAILVAVGVGGESFIHMGPSNNPAKVTAPEVPPCTDEGTTTQATCHWDAQTQGNGVGRSFTLYDYGQRVVYDKH